MLSKLILASCVQYSDRAYYGLCVLIEDIGRRLPLELQCSNHGQQGDVSQSVRGNYKTHIIAPCIITVRVRSNVRGCGISIVASPFVERGTLFIIQIRIHSSCVRSKIFVEAHLCKLCGILRSRVLGPFLSEM